jgi:anti-anti-sigma factor
MPLELKTRKQSDVSIVECVGRVVFGEETTNLRSLVKELIAQDPRVVLDFEKVRDIDSGGVGMLLGLLTSSMAAGGALKLARINKKVHQTLSVTRLLGILTAYDTVEKAVAAFHRDPEPPQGI